MCIGNGQIFENTLNGAVFTERTVQRIKGDIRAQLIEYGRDIAPHIDPGNLVALALKRERAGIARRQADWPLRRKPTQKNSYVLAAHRYL
ncbi:hypothetical protein D3C78_792320 [compost metagenome]